MSGPYIERNIRNHRLSMLRRLLLVWLVTSILGYGMALAYDLHGQPGDTAAVTTGHLPPADDDHHSDDGDHCCHGAVHLLGLGQQPLPGLEIDTVTPDAIAVIDARSLTLATPLRPPITG